MSKVLYSLTGFGCRSSAQGITRDIKTNVREKEKQILDKILQSNVYDRRIRPSGANGTGNKLRIALYLFRKRRDQRAEEIDTRARKECTVSTGTATSSPFSFILFLFLVSPRTWHHQSRRTDCRHHQLDVPRFPDDKRQQNGEYVLCPWSTYRKLPALLLEHFMHTTKEGLVIRGAGSPEEQRIGCYVK